MHSSGIGARPLPDGKPETGERGAKAGPLPRYGAGLLKKPKLGKRSGTDHPAEKLDLPGFQPQ